MLRLHRATCLFVGLLAFACGPAGAREVRSLDADWRFLQGDPANAQSPDFDDNAWQPVSTPHDWAIAGPYDEQNPSSGEGGYLPTGVGWYRQEFATSNDWQGKRVLVQFDGAMAHSDVWINGHHLGNRPNGYVSFTYDLTDHLHPAGPTPNVLAVRTDTSQQVAERWYTGSGIYRHVRLLVLDPLHVAVDGIGVTTPVASADKAEVAVAVDLANAASQVADAVVRVTLKDPAGVEVAQQETSTNLPADQTRTINLNLQIQYPQRWDLATPHLYTAHTQVLRAGAVVDTVTTPFGIRDAQFKAESGFWLNGRNFKLYGVCLHHCAGAAGAAVPLDLWQYRLEKLKTLGVNAIRTAHNPVAPEFLDLCDRMGLLVMDEFFDCWLVGKRKHDYHHHFQEWAHRDLRDTLRRDRNHPSIILYSVGNEIHDTPHEEQAKRILRGLVDVCHATDPTRPVTQALFRPNVSHDYDNGLADMLDVIGTNYRDLELLQAWRDNPNRKIVGTEQSHDRPIWLACRDNAPHAGQFLWCGIDYLGESRRWPVTTFNAGLLDRSGWTRPRGYERQSWWTQQPMVRAFRRVAPTEQTPSDPGYEAVEWKRRQVLFSNWTPEQQDPAEQTVEVYSNCPQVELLLNGQSLGKQPLPSNARPRIWKVAYQPGELLAVGQDDAGQELTRHTLVTAGPAARIELTASRKTLPQGWDHLAVLNAVVVDENGVRVPLSADKIHFTVAGPGAIVGIDNGSIVNHESFVADQRSAHQGRCMALLKATAAGTMTITASSPGLQAGQVQLVSGQ